jgi:caspase domain-containing protein
MLKLISAALSLAAMLFVSAAPAAAQSRVALVIGNSAYTSAPPLRTTAADADLVAFSLQAAGFDIVRANDVTTANFGDTIAAFLDKVSAAGPNAVAFVYFAGYGVQYDGDSYLVPVDAAINRAEDTPNATMSLSSIVQALGQVPAAARIIVLDAARDGGFGNAGNSPVAPGLALVGVPPGFLLAYPAAPGADICACAEDAPNSPYASSLATLLRQPGLEIGQVFDGVRLQINQASGGAQVPWMVSALGVQVRFFQATAQAPRTFLPALGVENMPVPPLVPVRWTRDRYRELSADEAYRIAIERDSLETYQWFVESYPTYPLAGQIWRIIHWRREAILWHRALVIGTVAAYWNYLDAYPDGLYVRQARYWLEWHHAPMVPRGYAPVFLELPPGYVDEAVGLPIIVERGRPVPRVFGNVQPIYIEAAPRWTPPTVIIVVRPPPPPPPQTLIVREAVFAQRPPGGAQPVQPVINPSLNPQQQQQKQRELQAWQARVNQQQQAVAKQYHAPVVTQTSIVLPPANPAGQQKPAGIQIPNKPGIAPPANNNAATAPGGTQQAVTPPPNKGLTIPNAKPAPGGAQQAVTPPPNKGVTIPNAKPAPGGAQQAVTPPPNKGVTIPNAKPAPGGAQQAVTPPPNKGVTIPNAKPAPGGAQQAVTPPPNKGVTIPNAKPAPNGTQHAVTPPPQQTPGGTTNKPGSGGPQHAITPPPQQQAPGGVNPKQGGPQRTVTPPPKGGTPPNNNAAQQQRLLQEQQEKAARERAAQQKAAQEKAAQERAALERQRQQQQKPVPPHPPQPPQQQVHQQQPPPQPPKPPQPPQQQQVHQQQPPPKPPQPPQPPQQQQVHQQQPPPKPPQPAPHPPACPAGEHMLNGKCVR